MNLVSHLACGQGDVLIIHPLLVHAPSSAHRATRAQPRAAEAVGLDAAAVHEGCGWVRHGLRITFNLATQWRRGQRLRSSEADRGVLTGMLHGTKPMPVSPIEECLI